MDNIDWKAIKSIEKDLLTGHDPSEYYSDSLSGNGLPEEAYSSKDACPIEEEQVDNSDEYKWLHEYKWLYKTFGKNVFDYDEKKHIIKLHKDFKAREEYILCLATILNKNNTLKKYRNKISDLFERVSAHAIKRYVGDHWKFFLIDQNKTSGGKTEITKLKEFLAKTNDPKIKENINKFDFNGQKLTTDIIVLKELDLRGGMLALAVECKSGRNWGNSDPANIEAWKELGIISIPVFTVTDLLDNDRMFEHQCDSNKEKGNSKREKGLIFDRARIIRLLATVKNSELSRIRQMIKKYKLEDALYEL